MLGKPAPEKPISHGVVSFDDDEEEAITPLVVPQRGVVNFDSDDEDEGPVKPIVVEAPKKEIAKPR